MKRRPNIKAAGFITKIKVLFTVRDFAQHAQSQNIGFPSDFNTFIVQIH